MLGIIIDNVYNILVYINSDSVILIYNWFCSCGSYKRQNKHTCVVKIVIL